jgi:hypothetical protein
MPEQVAQKLYEIEKRALEPDDVMFRVLAAVYQNDGGVKLSSRKGIVAGQDQDTCGVKVVR